MSEINKYIRGKIYTIRCRTDDTLIFVGSTTRHYLSSRFAQHKNKCKKGKSGSLYKHITDNDWSDWYIELYERFPCNDRAELCKREGEVIRDIGTINKNIAGRTNKESFKNWYENNHEKHLENCKKWQADNREKHLENCKRWKANNTEHIKAYHKEWRARKRSATP